MSDYNGYPNRATWNVSLWMNNEEWIYRDKERMVRRSLSVKDLATELEEFCREIWPSGVTPDHDRLSECDWESLAADEWADAGKAADNA